MKLLIIQCRKARGVRKRERRKIGYIELGEERVFRGAKPEYNCRGGVLLSSSGWYGAYDPRNEHLAEHIQEQRDEYGEA